MLSVVTKPIMLSVTMPSVVMLNVILLSVVVPFDQRMLQLHVGKVTFNQLTFSHMT
jgi:hypothetical protein